MERYAIIVAGGSGIRMQSGIPKQFIPIGEKPVLMHTMAAFKAVYEDIHIITVLPEKYIRLWKDLCVEFSFNISHTTTPGGRTRYESVKQGLKLVHTDGIIGVHDGVRPFGSQQTIRTAYETAEVMGAAIPVIELNDSLRLLHNGATLPADRNRYRLVQTPQCFRAEILKKAYEAPYRIEFTDDATIVEAAGYTVELTPGNFENIKITRTIDLAFAEVLTKKRFII
jgi:2-C-methyl-D-erythritol 4-phosphate cytidylyltransferase